MRAPVALLLAGVLAGCGSTVQVSGSGTLATGGADGLSAPTQQQGTAAADLPTTAGTASSTLPGSVPTSSSSGPRATAGPTVGPLPSTTTTQAQVTTPIDLGFMTTNVGNAQSAGLNVGQTYSDKQAIEALVKEYNAHGGLAGRKIVPYYGETDTASNDWNTQFQAACQNLTQDHHVKAVLGYVFVFLDSFEQCLGQKRIPHLYGGYQPGDRQAQKDFPGIVSVAHPTVDLMNETVLTGAIASGRLTTKSKLGILYDGCAHGDRAFKVNAEPFLKAHGIHYEAVYGDCSSGAGDVGAAAAAVKSAQLQFATHGVDVVYVPNAIGLLLFMGNAESQGYRPSYINPGGGGALEAQGGAVPQAQLKNLHSYGWMPAIDVGQNNQPYAQTPEQAACLAKLKHQGLVPKAFNDFMFAYVTCDSLDLYDRALRVTGGRDDGFVVRQALVKVMPSFRGASTYQGAYQVSPVQRGGAGRYREVGWNDGCSCFRYLGPVRSVPSS